MVETFILYFLSKVINAPWINTLIMTHQRTRMVHKLSNNPEIESIELKGNWDLKLNKYRRSELNGLAPSQSIQKTVTKQLFKRKNRPKRKIRD
jgi:hypothetical protein